MKTNLKVTTALFTVCIFAAGSFVVSAKPHTTSNTSKFGGVRAKEIHYKSEIDPKYTDEYKSERISKLIGHKTIWRKIKDSREYHPVRMHNASNLGSLLIRGNSYQWKSFSDRERPTHSIWPENDFNMGEIYIDPSMAPKK